MEAKEAENKTHELPDESDPEISFSTRTDELHGNTSNEDPKKRLAQENDASFMHHYTHNEWEDKDQHLYSGDTSQRPYHMKDGTILPPRPPSKNAHKYPLRPGIIFEEGARVEAKDFQKKWYPARMVEVDDDELKVLIHFDGWNQRYDEWLDMNSDRLRPMTRHSSRTIKTKPNVTHIRANTSPTEKKNMPGRNAPKRKLEHKIGENVFAKWTDCRMYPARVVSVNPNGTYEVLFYDGFKKVVQPINVRSIPPDVQKEYAAAGLLAEPGRKMKINMKDLQKELEQKRHMIRRRDSSGGRKDTAEGTDDTAEFPDDLSPPQPAAKSQRSQSKSSDDGAGSSKDVTITPSRGMPTKPGSRKDRRRRSSSKPKPATSSTPKSSSAASSPAPTHCSTPEPVPSPKPLQETKPVPEPKPVLDPKPVLEPKPVQDAQEPVAAPVPVPVSVLSQTTPTGSASHSASHSPESSRTSTPLTTPVSSCAPTPEAPSSSGPRLKQTPSSTPSSTVTLSSSSTPAAPAPSSSFISTPPPGAPEEEWTCPWPQCPKTFRKESLVEYHVKYYHTEDGTPVQPSQPRKRRKTASICSTESELSVGGAKKRRESSLSDYPPGAGNDTPLVTPITMEVDEFNLVEEEVVTTVVATVPASSSASSLGIEVAPVEEEEEDDDPQDRLTKDEVVNCICQINEENGLMIQCEVCLCWQHALCMEITDETLPAKYVCYVCLNPPGVRETAKYLYDQDWLRQGYMARFGFLSEDRLSGHKASIMAATHHLVADMHNVNAVLRATQNNMHALANPLHNPQVSFWKKDWDTIMKERSAQRIAKFRRLSSPSPTPSITSTSTKTEVKDDPGADSDSTIEMDPAEYSRHGTSDAAEFSAHSKEVAEFSENCKDDVAEFSKNSNEKAVEFSGKGKGEAAEISMNVNREKDSAKVDEKAEIKTVLDCKKTEDNKEEKTVANLTVKQEPKGVEEHQEEMDIGLDLEVKIEDGLDLFVPDSMQEVTVKVEEEDEEDEESCRWRLLHHIQSTQDSLERRLDLIDQQVTELEGAEDHNGKPRDVLDDLPRVKNAVHFLISDLSRVQKMAMYH